MKIVAVIPARMGSSRFPGKPMAPICGTPMVGHVLKNTQQSKIIHSTYVATCDAEIKDYIESVGGQAIMTKSSHERCTDRVAEAIEIIEKNEGEKVDIVVLIQGDEPMLDSSAIDSVITPMIENSNIQVTNLMTKIKTREEIEDPNEVKVVVDQSNNALYFSREPIPSNKKFDGEYTTYKQVCVIPFRRQFLKEFQEMIPTPLEKIESIDMMRILEHGKSVKMIYRDIENYSVDTMEDLKKVEKVLSRAQLN